MTTLPLPGVAVGIVVGDELVLASGYGVTDLGGGSPVTADTLFQIASATKPFTTTLVGILEEEGRLSFDSELADRIPSGVRISPALDAGAITLGQLASHLSGLPASAPIAGRDVDPELVLSFTHFELWKSLAEVEPVAPPGETFHYSMLGYGLLGYVLEVETDRPFEVLLRERILAPLGMSRTTLTLRPEHLPFLATPYHHVPGAAAGVPTMPADMEALAPAGGLASSVRDLARFVALHLGHGEPELLTEETLAELHRTVWRFSDRLGYALGWGTDRLPAIDRVVFHDGRNAGYTSYVGLAPEDGVGVVVLTNLGGDATPKPIRELGHGLLRAAALERRRSEGR